MTHPGIDLATRLEISASARPATTSHIDEWLASCQRRSPFMVERVPLTQLDKWLFEPTTGDLLHQSGRFFGVQGLQVETDYGPVGSWGQPILNQTDCAILGILARETDGVLRFLMQAKMEPGNCNTVQISPTVQATPSNYRRVHKGSVAPYVDHFVDPAGGRVLVDSLQSEQGSWFVAKRNRNMILEVTDDVPPNADFMWLTLGEIFELLQRPNVINMDARSVLSCLPLPYSRSDGRSDRLESGAIEATTWLNERKAHYNLAARMVPLQSLADWTRSTDEIAHRKGLYFAIVGVRVAASNREVRSWCQPLLEPRGVGLTAFLIRRRGDTVEVLVRADLRPGNNDIIEVGPTVQSTPENHPHSDDTRSPLLDLVRSDHVTVHYDVIQSEEGGRFNRARTRHLIVEADPGTDGSPPADHRWLTVAQLQHLVSASYRVNIEARSLLLCLHSLSLDTRPDDREATGGLTEADTSALFLFDEAMGYLTAAALRAVATIGIADALDRPRSITELARVTGVSEDRLDRVLKLVAARGIVVRTFDGRYRLHARGQALRSNADTPAQAGILMLTDPLFWTSTNRLSDTLVDTEPSMERAFGTTPERYFADDERAKLFYEGMSVVSAAENRLVAASYDYPPDAVVADIGGRSGALLLEVLRNRDDLNGILFDRDPFPEQVLINTSEVDDRWETHQGDFLDELPAADVMMLKRILHNWSDDDCVTILRNCRDALKPGGTVLVVDAIIPDHDEAHASKQMDVMMLAVASGQERTADQLRTLFDRAGLRLTRVIPTPSPMSIAEGVRAS